MELPEKNADREAQKMGLWRKCHWGLMGRECHSWRWIEESLSLKGMYMIETPYRLEIANSHYSARRRDRDCILEIVDATTPLWEVGYVEFSSSMVILQLGMSSLQFLSTGAALLSHSDLQMLSCRLRYRYLFYSKRTI